MTLALLTLVAFLSADSSDRSVSGMVQDATGGAVAAADVFVACGPVWRHTVTDASGSFRVGELPQGRCGLRVEGDSFSPHRLTVDLSRSDQRVTVVLDLRGLTTEIAVTPSRASEESLTEVPAHTTVTTADEIRARAHQILPQALAEEPGVVVQQTTSAQGAPVIRGLIGYQNVALVDGVRLNTSSWRSGPLQYLAWYDPSLVDRIEVMRGPGSVLYGSDALGGTIHVRSLQPSFSTGGVTAGGVANLAVSSADTGRGGSARVHVQAPRAALIAGGGYTRFGDIRPGKGTDSHAAVTRFLGLPSDVLGSTRMRDTGYDQRFGHVAAAFGLGTSRLDASYHYDEQTGASRYDRIFGGEGLYRSEFGPQRLDLAQLRLERGVTGFFDGFSASVSVNRQDDGRLEQARPTSSIDEQTNATTVFGYQAQGVRTLGRHQVTTGAELYDEYISGSRTVTAADGAVRAARPDIPDGTRYTSLGVFAQDVVNVVPGRLSVRGGVRYGRFDFGTTADPVLGVLDESVSSDAVTFQAGTVVSLTETVKLTASAGRAFRAPNASDLGAIGVTSVFEVAPSRAMALGGLMGDTGGATAVSTGRPIEPLGPETLYSYEAGLRYDGRRVQAGFTAYDIEMRNAIQRRTVIFQQDITGSAIGGFDIVRQDAAGRAYIATQASPLVTRVNVSEARIAGFEASARVRLSADWLASGVFSYSHGTDLDADVPLRRVPPGVGVVRLRWQPASRPFWIEGVGTFMTRYARLAPGDMSDARMGGRRDTRSIASYFNGTAVDLGLMRDGVLLPTGETLAQVQQRVLGGASSALLFDELPGHFVTTVRGTYRVSPQVELMVIGDNLFDVNYRHLGSGVDAPGANIRVHTRILF